MARISLIYPSDGLCYKFARNRTRRMPLGLAYIAAALEKAQHDVSVTDGALHDLSVEDTVERAMKTDPQFVGIGCTTPLYHQAVAIIDLIKKLSPNTIVLFGGPHVSALPDPTLNSSRADFVCIGEGEESVVAIIDNILSGKNDFKSIPGIAYRTDTGAIEHNVEYRLRLHQSKVTTVKAIDLNKCPMAARHLFEWTKYVDYARDIYTPQTGTMFSRGCPGKSYDDKTEIYSENGWKLFKDLKDEEKVAAYHPETDSLIFEIPRGRLTYPYKDDMIHIHNKQVDIMVTSNHVNYCNTNDGVYSKKPYRFEDAIKFLELGENQQRAFLKGCNGHQGKNEPIVIGKHTFEPTTFFKFMGYYLSEGYTVKKEGAIWLYQNEDSPAFQSMLQCTKDMGMRSFIVKRPKKLNAQARAIIFKCKDLADYLRPLGRSWEKGLYKELLSYDKKYLKIFLDAYVEGDGSINIFKNKSHAKPQTTIYTTSKKMADDIQYITFLLGRSANVFIKIRDTERLLQDHIVKKSRPLYQITIPTNDSNTFITGADVKRVPYNGMAYCVEVSTGVILIRRNNKVILNGNCAFCGAADTLVRWRHTDNIVDELKQIEDMGIKNVFIMDDTYTNNKKRIMEISQRIIDRGIKLHMSVQLRLDQLDKEVCDIMYASGIRYVGPGIESGNEEIMKAIGKGPKENKHHMREKMDLLKQYDWRVRCSYVFGMTGETEEQIMETIEFAKELKADENAFSILVPYPDSPLWAVAKARGLVHDYMDFSKFLYYHEIGANLSAVPTERLLELHEFAYEYVGNPAYALDDNSVSSGNRPHVPYLTSEAFRKFREAERKAKEVSHDQVDIDLDLRRRSQNAM